MALACWACLAGAAGHACPATPWSSRCTSATRGARERGQPAVGNPRCTRGAAAGASPFHTGGCDHSQPLGLAAEASA
eukprot:11716659-Heterocapsa_arctica.AAC.1